TRELQAEDFQFNAFGDIDASVAELNQLLGDELNSLVAASRGDGMEDFFGPIHLASVAIGLSRSSDGASFSTEHRLVDANLSLQGTGETRIDLGKQTIEYAGIERQWEFTDNTVASSTLSADIDSKIGDTNHFAPMMVAADGRLIFASDDDGIVSDDGSL